MLWTALLPTRPSTPEALVGIATWALQFSPRVAVIDEAVLVELEGSTRLFGGRRKLGERLRDEGEELGLKPPSWAPTGQGALAIARCGRIDGVRRPLAEVLDPLPLDSLSAVRAHQPMLARLGCRKLGDVRALPRGGLARRFGAPMLTQLDQAYGQLPEAYTWAELAESFDARLELMTRVEQSPALLFGARRLLLQLCGWLAARRSGARTFTLRWMHDTMRSNAAGEGGELTVRTAETTRNVEHLCRLLAEHLAHVSLAAPVSDIRLIADEVIAMEEKSATLLPDPAQDTESLALVLERIAARLGPERVLRPVPRADHRLEWMTHWQPAAEPLPRAAAATRAAPTLPQPTFAFPQPLKLAVRGQKPLYQGELLLLCGPHRVEAGWWDRAGEDGEHAARLAVRDYWVALSPHAGVLWIYQTRLDEAAGWWLQGIFA